MDRINARIETFKQHHPSVWSWLESEHVNFEFARSLRHQVMRSGALTPRQIEAAERSAIRKAVKSAEVAASAPAHDTDIMALFGIEFVEAAPVAPAAPKAPAIKTDKLSAAFKSARAKGLKRPVLRFDAFNASLAPEGGRNPGAIYIKTKSGEYAGKISRDGEFTPSRDCPADMRAAIEATMADPLAAAVAYGKRTGTCSCCGRTLENGESIDRGIGPVCAEKFGL